MKHQRPVVKDDDVGKWERMARLVASKPVNLTGVITDRLSLDDAEEGFQRVIKGESGKILFTP